MVRVDIFVLFLISEEKLSCFPKEHGVDCGLVLYVIYYVKLYSFHRRRQWQPTTVLLPGNSHGWRSLVGCGPWGCKELDTTEQLHFYFSLFTFMHWRRKWQPTPVFLPGESQGWGSLVACHLWVAQSQTRLKQLSSSSSSIFLPYPFC